MGDDNDFDFVFHNFHIAKFELELSLNHELTLYTIYDCLIIQKPPQFWNLSSNLN